MTIEEINDALNSAYDDLGRIHSYFLKIGVDDYPELNQIGVDLKKLIHKLHDAWDAVEPPPPPVDDDFYDD